MPRARRATSAAGPAASPAASARQGSTRSTSSPPASRMACVSRKARTGVERAVRKVGHGRDPDRCRQRGPGLRHEARPHAQRGRRARRALRLGAQGIDGRRIVVVVEAGQVRGRGRPHCGRGRGARECMSLRASCVLDDVGQMSVAGPKLSRQQLAECVARALGVHVDRPTGVSASANSRNFWRQPPHGATGSPRRRPPPTASTRVAPASTSCASAAASAHRFAGRPRSRRCSRRACGPARRAARRRRELRIRRVGALARAARGRGEQCVIEICVKATSAFLHVRPASALGARARPMKPASSTTVST